MNFYTNYLEILYSAYLKASTFTFLLVKNPQISSKVGLACGREIIVCYNQLPVGNRAHLTTTARPMGTVN